MTTITVFLAKDVLDDEMSFFAFEHFTGSHSHMYSHCTVIDIDTYGSNSLTEKLVCIIEVMKCRDGCEWADENEDRRMCDMIDPVDLESFGLGSAVAIKVRKSGALLPGIRVLTGYSGRKVWRTVSKERLRSATCYSVHFEDVWNEVAGTGVKYLTK
ncbi:hypothetical protein HOS16_gp63 [Shigella phage vB_SflS-ISF001]|uniref:Uncharacterized protein n=1 Tax=Shigella phage vB_SflS-ISF001 TaxID=2048005 RepID=A0A2D1GQD2_9CAUD|nr:hypothetical protein HOS16_gp63 [Shigella phage vB_SflS-ISF001]ATN94141.1 hypothetical protein FLXISF001_063 [Shigella phage vB_SflS-ISF001]